MTTKRYIHIKANGPFFEVDAILPEKKAETYLRRLRRIQQREINRIKENLRDQCRERYWSRGGWKYRRPRIEFNAAEHGIKPTTIITTVI